MIFKNGKSLLNQSEKTQVYHLLTRGQDPGREEREIIEEGCPLSYRLTFRAPNCNYTHFSDIKVYRKQEKKKKKRPLCSPPPDVFPRSIGDEKRTTEVRYSSNPSTRGPSGLDQIWRRSGRKRTCPFSQVQTRHLDRWKSRPSSCILRDDCSPNST